MQLKHGQTYLSRDGTKILIKKEKWDCWFMGYSVSNGVFMGKYNDDGSTVEGLPHLHDLLDS